METWRILAVSAPVIIAAVIIVLAAIGSRL